MKKVIAFLFILTFLFVPAFAEVVTETAAETASEAAPVFMIDITQIVTSVIGLLLSILFAWLLRVVVPPVKAWLEARTTETQRNMLNTLVGQLVLAAEQTIGMGKGKEKLQFVVDQLKQRGYTVDLAAIEACVKEMNDNMINEIAFLHGEEETDE